MLDKIEEKIKAINEALSWLKANNPEEYQQKFVPLVEKRCKLRKIYDAKLENPAIAAYGESQKGKSYLMGNLLQNNGKPFEISLPDGKTINFVDSINPISDNREATGVVTRFTAYQGLHAERYSREYPVLMKLLTVGDIATIICDGYFKDLMDYKSYSDSEIKAISNRIYEKYKDLPEIADTHLVEDDILDIRTYLDKYVKANAQCLLNGTNRGIFDRLAMIIRRVPQSEWGSVLSFLWHENDILTRLFNRLVGAISRLRFAKEVYLPIDAVRHLGDNKNTIMSVKCLKKLDDPDFNLTSDVFIKESDNTFTKVAAFNKSELCAICAETSYKVDADYLTTQMRYCMADIPPQTQKKMQVQTLCNDVINVSDLLDFPGARNRLKNEERMLEDYDPEEESSNLVQMLLRGKVAYLFNKYCSSRAINILMFCHDHEQPSVTEMYSVIRDWVDAYVGKTFDARKKRLELSDGISPLFVIATKFNIDMRHKQNVDANSDTALKQRWDGRFNEVLYSQSFKANSVEWFRNWIKEGESFKNCYLLRDFKYSGCDGDGTHLYRGYSASEGTSESELALPKDFYERMRSSFINSEVVGKFFEDPEMAWDLAATMANDGALYIIERLCKVARKMSEIRDTQFNEELDEICREAYRLLEDNHEPEDNANNLSKEISTAVRIRREAGFASDNNNYFFGHLIQCLQLNYEDTYDFVHKIISSGELVGDVTNYKHELIRAECDHFKGCSDLSAKWKRLMLAMGYDTIAAAEKDLIDRCIKPEELFAVPDRASSNSVILSERVFNAWIEQLRSSDIRNQISDATEFVERALNSLTKRIIDTAVALRLCDYMADAVSCYLDVVNVYNAKSDLVSDVLTHIINTFVTDFGYSLRSQEEIEQFRIISEQNNLKLYQYIDKGYADVPEEDEIAGLFKQMRPSEKTNEEPISKSFTENYRKWLEYMFIAFIAETKHVIKNPEANHALGLILQKLKNANL